MRDNRHGPRRANGIRRDGLRTRAVPLRNPDLLDTDMHEPIDLVAVQADDELINALSAGYGGPAPAPGYVDTDDRMAAILASWKAEVDAEPIPELVDLDTAVATVKAARPRSARIRHLAPLAAAVAVIALAAGGVSVGSYSAQPHDVLWPITQVVFPTKAKSVEAAGSAQDHIDKAKQALVSGRPGEAAQELKKAQVDLGAVRAEEGQVELADVQDFLMVKAQETPPGTRANLAAPLATQPRRQVPPAVVASVPEATSSSSSSTAAPARPSQKDPTLPVNPAITPGPDGSAIDPDTPRDRPPVMATTPAPTPVVVVPPVVGTDPGAVTTTTNVPDTSSTTPDRNEGQAPVNTQEGVTGEATPTTS